MTVNRASKAAGSGLLGLKLITEKKVKSQTIDLHTSRDGFVGGLLLMPPYVNVHFIQKSIKKRTNSGLSLPEPAAAVQGSPVVVDIHL